MQIHLVKWTKYTLLTIFSLFMSIPLLWMMITSLKTKDEASNNGLSLWVSNPQWSNYLEVFRQSDLYLYISNTLFYAITTAILSVVLALFAAYALTFIQFKGRRLLLIIFIFTMFLPAHMTLIPSYLTLNSLGWLDSYKGLIIPSAVTGFNIFLMYQGLRQIPKSLIESAKVDGASHLRILFQIVAPLTLPSMATLGIIVFTYQYNNYFWPLVVTSSEETKTISIALAEMIQTDGAYGIQWPLIMAANTISILPVMFLFLVLQKLYIRGVMYQGMKD
ncbi:carbohydrate ABC transporter permease [Pseudalkalibacillus berkeleyi]|uniref:Carbohydrate ABC transporter permease n=1 Tax=Pseudalkalibacillus berkeleyi TaxID=1069813 RepID=A0ABS9GUV7_9BACL|nr:carbohydrate ABC transporter permease [Pseudalkalibacillus berkeleyi]MCF6136624.1 carbohydrate ABC transporter permease [Pseudalkalibacillus berkeleyi]